MKKKILIVCNANPATNPRPNRMIHYLKDTYQVTVFGQKEVCIEGVTSIGFLSSSGPSSSPSSSPKAPRTRLFAETQERLLEKPLGRLVVLTARTLMRWLSVLVRLPIRLVRLPIHALKKARPFIRLARKQYENIWASKFGQVTAFQNRLAAEEYDIVISHDIVMMPLVARITANKKTKILLDAREFYPRAYEDQWRWRWESKPFYEYLCERYLPECDKVITVSSGLAQEYKQVYHVEPEVFMSLPTFRDLSPVPVKEDQVRLIHHGVAHPARRTELMIEMMDYVDERFSLDLMLLVGSGKYWDKIVSMIRQRKNVQLIPPVPLQQIVPVTNQYDIGLYLLPPSNFNVKHSLPNKFFEFIQARVAVAIGPSIEMSELVRKFNCGVISKDFDPKSLANELNQLTAEKIMELKKNSHAAARELNAEANAKRIREIVRDLTGDQATSG